MPFRILVADDHGVVRKALRAEQEVHLDWQVCAEAANGLEAVQLRPDIIILDLAMPEMTGFRLRTRFSQPLPRSRF